MPNPDEPAAPSSGYRPHAYYLNTDQHHERLKAAWWGTRELEGENADPSLNALVARLFEAEAERLEREHNDGRPFPPAPKRARGVNPTAAARQAQKVAEAARRRRGES